DDPGVRRLRRERAAEGLDENSPLSNRNLHALLPTVTETVVGLVHRADVLQCDVLVVFQPLDDTGEVLRVRGLAARFEAAAARLPVCRELRGSAIDESGEEWHVRVVRGAHERQTAGIGRFLFGCPTGRLHTDTAAPV